ncbi:OmpH family outer membrane protein [Bacteroides sp. 224]|uniref:OmpH family outer membrane protein n=1 Tax=Bacteroides sp. 224 TaxID=2302936 RepID=UPI0013D16DE1|nr:OmpH family outer membrane protein [Bacteroides sp. 224]NDV65710.1 OmpH family outer membrane protein [Bacteroides sp. 224]
MKKTVLLIFFFVGTIFCVNAQETEFGTTTPVQVLKIGYVNMDSLLTNYKMWNDMMAQTLQKEENIRTSLNLKMKDLEKEIQLFQEKIEKNAFISAERAQQEYDRIQNRQENLEKEKEQLAVELKNENDQNAVVLHKAISAFIEEYAQEKGYDFILTNSGFDNILYGKKEHNVTQEVVEGLNARLP